MSDQPSSGPTIGQAFIAGILFAALGSLAAWLGSVLSEELPATLPTVDALDGAGSPAELNARIDTVLEAGSKLLEHDAGAASLSLWIVIAVAVLALGGAICYVVRQRTRGRVPSGMEKTFVGVSLSAASVGLGVLLVTSQDAVLHSLPVVDLIGNSNTRPAVASRGESVWVELPVSMQSFFGYHTVPSHRLERAEIQLVDGSRRGIDLGETMMTEGGREPGATDFIPVMEQVEPDVRVSIPDQDELEGALLSVAVSGQLRLIPDRSKRLSSPRRFQAESTFRIARSHEVEFTEKFASIDSNLGVAMFIAFASSVVILLVAILGAPGAELLAVEDAEDDAGGAEA